jgi:hypothetical protein
MIDGHLLGLLAHGRVRRRVDWAPGTFCSESLCLQIPALQDGGQEGWQGWWLV